MWWDPDELGRWALEKCFNISINSKLSDIINLKVKKYQDIILGIEDDLVRSKWCYKYCKKVQDDIRMMRGITHPYWVEGYLINIREDIELRNIYNGNDLYYNYPMSFVSHGFKEMVEEKNIFRIAWIGEKI